MNSNWHITAFFSILLIGCIAGSVVVERKVDRLRPAVILEEVLYIPSSKVVKRMSVGYEALVADIYWTRAVQYFGSRHVENANQYKLLYPLLDMATDLDPHLIPAYEFGSVFLTQPPPRGAGEPLKAIALLKKGVERNPDSWRLYQGLGFVYYMELQDYPSAGKAFEQASKIPGAHPFLKVLAAKTLQQGGDYELARMLWQTIQETSSDAMVRDNASKHIRAMQVDSEVPQLEKLVEVYATQTGHLPASLADLVAVHWLRRIPRDPLGYPYVLLPDGHIQVRFYRKLPFITKGLPPGQQPSDLDLSTSDE
jgi:tetratricopeptide (TPR) repeat protein